MTTEATQRNLPAEWNGIVPAEVFFNEATRIVEKSKEADLTLRVMGGVGIGLHSTNERTFAERLGRMAAGKQEYTDLDFAGFLKERNRIGDFFSNRLSYAKRKTTISTAVSQRQIYFHPDDYFTVDVLMDKLLIANHPIDFRSRLGVDQLTLPLADLLLEKIQMWVSFSEKDLKDCLVLLKAHEISDDGSEDEMISSKYIAQLLSDDWGFYHTATTNLKRIVTIVGNLDRTGHDFHIDASRVSADERNNITGKIEHLLHVIDDRPKSWGWKARSKLGTKKQWYRDVETTQTVGDFGIWRLRETTGP